MTTEYGANSYSSLEWCQQLVRSTLHTWAERLAVTLDSRHKPSCSVSITKDSSCYSICNLNSQRWFRRHLPSGEQSRVLITWNSVLVMDLTINSRNQTLRIWQATPQWHIKSQLLELCKYMSQKIYFDIQLHEVLKKTTFNFRFSQMIVPTVQHFWNAPKAFENLHYKLVFAIASSCDYFCCSKINFHALHDKKDA